ncbi:MAG: DUF58 domain-containing protein [Acidobacteria bacterium]|nr:DUF58 domain-containing protein [Acidobacteriota bacterium]
MAGHADGAAIAPATLARFGDLELVARLVVDGLVSGLHRSPFHGYSAEFSQYRHYRPGDDLKYVDWKLFARTDRLYTKQYRETTNTLVALAVDTSASMAFVAGEVTKLRHAVVTAASLAHLLVAQGDSVGLIAYGARVNRYVPPRAGRGHLRGLLVALARLRAEGATDTAASIRRAADLMRRRGLLIVLSDLYDAGDPLFASLRRAVKMGHEVIVLHVIAPAERDLPYRGDVRLEDLETGRQILLDAAGARQAYQERFAGFGDECRHRLSREGIDYVALDTAVSPAVALRPYLVARRRRGAHS